MAMSRSASIALVSSCLVLFVSAALLIGFGAGGAIWLWFEATGTNRRVAAAAQIDATLRVTVESASRAYTSAPEADRFRPLTCRLRFENVGERDIAAFTGTILFTDGLGWTVFDCGVGNGRPLGAHEVVVEDRVLDCGAHEPSSGTADDIAFESLTSAWLANSLTYSDGTKVEVFPTEDFSGSRGTTLMRWSGTASREAGSLACAEPARGCFRGTATEVVWRSPRR